MTAFAETGWAKINLALHVRARRDDGYHEIETLFAFVEAVENRQAPAYFGPVGGVDRVVFEGAPTAPGLEGPHACGLVGMTTPP